MALRPGPKADNCWYSYVDMPIRVGIDLVSTESIRESIRAHGERYIECVYSPTEVADSTSGGTLDPERLAARFAAKEATFKVLRVGDQPVSWQDVEVVAQAGGWPELRVSGNAATLVATNGIRGLALSLTHDRGYAAAVVIADTAERGAAGDD
jgi:holo-[acyl-carrier protein] synthase